MTDEQLAEIKGRLAAITAGKWWVYEGDMTSVSCTNPEYGDQVIANTFRSKDAAFIAHAPADIDALIAENERLRAENDAMHHDLHVTDGLYAMDKPIAHDDAFRIEHRSLHSVSA